MRRVIAGCALIAMATALLAVPAGAADTVESAWWWREQPADGTLPPPPQVPDGGLRVASDASGPSAIAAVRIALGAGERNPVLTLKVAAGTLQAVVLNACPPTAAWTPVSAGAWSERPQPDCAQGAVAGSPSADATTVVFDLSTLPTPASGAYDVVVFPTAAQPLPADTSALPAPVPQNVAPTADIAFARPVASDVAVTGEPGASGDTGAGEPLADASPAYDFGATTSFDDAPPSVVGLPPVASPAVSTAPAPAPAPRTGAPLATLRPPTFRRVASTFDRVGEARDRLLAAFVFADLVAVWWLLNRRRVAVVDGDGRPRLSLHDDPTTVLAAHAARAARPVAADVPPLR